MVTVKRGAYRRGHRVLGQSAGGPPPPPAPLNLAAATFDEGVPSVTLAFARAVSIVAINPGAVEVGTISTGTLYQGVDASISGDGKTVTVNLQAIDTYPETNVTLFAGADNGIVASDDGAAWGGTPGTGLPYAG